MRFLAAIFLLLLLGCNSCKTPAAKEPPAPVMAPEVMPTPLNPNDYPPPPPPPLAYKAKAQPGMVVEKAGVLVTSPTPKRGVKKKVAKPIPIDTSINVRHPDHFFSKVWCQVSITLGTPLAPEAGTVEITDAVPQAAAYSVSLRGEPADQFEIKQGEQVVSAPTAKLPSSSVYFDVRPLSPGKKFLIYQVKARLSPGDPGIGLPEVTRDIVVEVNSQTRMYIFKNTILPYLLTFIGAIGTAVGGWLIKKWFSKKQ